MSRNGTTLVRFKSEQQKEIEDLGVPAYAYVRYKLGQFSEKDYEKYPQLKQLEKKQTKEAVQIQMRPEGIGDQDIFVKYKLAEQENKRLAEKIEALEQQRAVELNGVRGELQGMLNEENRKRELQDLKDKVTKLEAKNKKRKAIIEQQEAEIEDLKEKISVKAMVQDVGPAIINGFAHKFEPQAKAMAEGLAGLLTAGAYDPKQLSISQEDKQNLEVIRHLKTALSQDDMQKVIDLLTYLIEHPEMIYVIESFLQQWKEQNPASGQQQEQSN